MIFTPPQKPEEVSKLCESILKKLPHHIFQFRLNYKNQIVVDFLSRPYEFLEDFSLSDSLEDPYKLSNFKIYEPELNAFLCSYKRALVALEKWEIDFRLLRRDGGYKWVRIEANPQLNDQKEVLFYGVISDITCLKEQDINLKVSDERYHFAVQASDRGVWDWDLLTNKVYYSSESMKILELTHTDLIGSPEEWDHRVHPDDREEYYGQINLHFEDKIPFYETCHRVLCKGGYKWILDRGKVIERDSLGKPIRIVGTHTDISAQKEKELELAKTLRIVNVQNNKLLNFAHIVSHNLRTHSGNIKSLLELHKDALLSKEETLNNIQIVSDSLFSAIEDLNDLVSIYTESENNMQPLVVYHYIEKVLEVLNDAISQRGIRILNQVPLSAKVHSVPAYLESILLNLITNAIKYSDPQKEAQLALYLESNDDFMLLRVADNGIGIDLEKHKNSIFGLYKTFHSNSDAKGVGLYLTKNQIENMGGKIEVESMPSFGSTFKVYFKNMNGS